MKPSIFLAEPSFERTDLELSPLPQLTANEGIPGEAIRHILLGRAGAIRQTIHLLHSLHYAETVLWSPVLSVEEPLMITPARGEAVSLLRKLI